MLRESKNPIGRVLSYGLVMFFILGLVGFFLLRAGVEAYNEKDAGISAAIGSEIVLNGDTLMVMDYDWWENHYILNDGTQISTKLLDDLEYLPQTEANGNKEESEKTEGN